MIDIHANIGTIITTFDTHDVGIETWNDNTYRCACTWRGSATEWQAHLARAIDEAVNPAIQEVML